MLGHADKTYTKSTYIITAPRVADDSRVTRLGPTQIFYCGLKKTNTSPSLPPQSCLTYTDSSLQPPRPDQARRAFHTEGDGTPE